MDLSRARWRKSSRSGSDGGECVEVATNLPGMVTVRDSKHLDGAPLVFPPGAWAAFLGGVKRDAFRRVPAAGRGQPLV
ncbi:DUF397 domain-containing protein [Sphaerisporangium sp. TRM90804]|uniref:DUF397 domain-containing protein n=1 Tax=Sphaerisporangium sp. TRM90804 TaxID=3031113 RepID=UPI00244C4E30|nr:DUF397 domain-containing protein [Sphaerisporangium sp. TRM90804]MDH2428226.1 DUF397 domain-containing protein [Sphaerisporangium sp. TRM90804]